PTKIQNLCGGITPDNAKLIPKIIVVILISTTFRIAGLKIPNTLPPTSMPSPHTISTILISHLPPPKYCNVNSGNNTATGIIQKVAIVEYAKSQVSPLLSKIALKPHFRSAQACLKLAFALSGTSGFGIYTYNNALIATTAPTISNNNTWPIDINVMAKVPNAGPAIAEIDWIIWLTPAMR